MNKDNFLRFIIISLSRLIVSAIAEKVSDMATEARRMGSNAKPIAHRD
jgi:hypothetical protein